jgi:hypothetical protein
MRILIAAGLAGILAGCATQPLTPEACGPQPTQLQIDEAVKAYVANVNWKDPGSVQVRNVHMTRCARIPNGLLVPKEPIPNGWEILLDVNAKNSYGGYTGFEVRSIIRTVDGKIHY